MSQVILDIPKGIKDKFGIGEKISYETLIIKTVGKEFISPDLEFNSYDDMLENHKKEYDKLENIDKSSLLNI